MKSFNKDSETKPAPTARIEKRDLTAAELMQIAGGIEAPTRGPIKDI